MFSIFIYKIPDVGRNHVNLHLEIFSLATKMTRNHKHNLSVQIYNSFVSPPSLPPLFPPAPLLRPSYRNNHQLLHIKGVLYICNYRNCLVTLKSPSFPPIQFYSIIKGEKKLKLSVQESLQQSFNTNP